MEVLFGGSKPPFIGRRNRGQGNEAAHSVLPRTLLPWSVIYSEATNMVRAIGMDHT